MFLPSAPPPPENGPPAVSTCQRPGPLRAVATPGAGGCYVWRWGCHFGWQTCQEGLPYLANPNPNLKPNPNPNPNTCHVWQEGLPYLAAGVPPMDGTGSLALQVRVAHRAETCRHSTNPGTECLLGRRDLLLSYKNKIHQAARVCGPTQIA